MKKRSVYFSTRWCTIAHLEKNSIMVHIKLPLFWDKEIWPPSSPDLNPLDFSIWSMLKKDACRSEKLSVNHLKKSLQKAWADNSQKKIRAAVEAFRSRLEKVIDANGGQIELK